MQNHPQLPGSEFTKWDQAATVAAYRTAPELRAAHKMKSSFLGHTPRRLLARVRRRLSPK